MCWARLERGSGVGLQGSRIWASSMVHLPLPHGGLEAGVGWGAAAWSETLGRHPGHLPHHHVRAAPWARGRRRVSIRIRAQLRMRSPEDQFSGEWFWNDLTSVFPDHLHDADTLPHPAATHRYHDAARLALHVLRYAGVLRQGTRTAPGHVEEVSHLCAGALTCGVPAPLPPFRSFSRPGHCQPHAPFLSGGGRFHSLAHPCPSPAPRCFPGSCQPRSCSWRVLSTETPRRVSTSPALEGCVLANVRPVCWSGLCRVGCSPLAS